MKERNAVFYGVPLFAFEVKLRCKDRIEKEACSSLQAS